MAEEIIPVLDVDLVGTPAEDEGLVEVEDPEWVDPFLIKHLNEAEYIVSGTGNYFDFLRIGSNDDVSEGINTDANPLPLDDNGQTQNNALKLSQIPIVVIDGVEYYEIRLDVNEPNSDETESRVSLNEIQLFLSTKQATVADINADRSETALDGDFTKVFDLDATTDKTLVLRDDYSGSGRDDYILYIPVSQVGNLTGVSASNTFVSLYVQFGPTPPQDSGFEEFRVRSSVVINGVKFADVDGDGVRDDGEGGIGGIKVFLDLDANGILSTGDRVTTTAADGSFEFTGLPTLATDQNYYVYEVLTPEQEALYLLTTGNVQGGHLVTIGSNGSVSSLAIGNMPIIKDLEIVKTVDSIVDGPDATLGNAADGKGDIINYLISVTNTGNVPLTNLNVSDLLEGATNLTLTLVSNGDGDAIFDVDEVWTFSASYTLTQADLDNKGDGDGEISNTATASAEYKGDPVGPRSDFVETPLVYNPDFTVLKTVTAITGDSDNNGKVDLANGVISYSIVVQNTGNITLTQYVLSDPNATTLSAVSGDDDGDGDLDVGETWNYTATHVVTQDELDDKGTGIDGTIDGDGDTDNRVTVTTKEAGSKYSEVATGLDYRPDFTVVKEVTSIVDDSDFGASGVADSDGDIINYSITIENTGNITLTDFAYVDQNTDGDVLTYAGGDSNGDGDLDVGETWTYSGKHTVTQAELDGKGTGADGALDGDGDTDNKVTVSFDEAGPKDSSVATPLVYKPDFTVVKAVTSITGDSDNNGKVDTAGGVINYSIVVQNTGNITLTGYVLSDPNATTLSPVSGDDNDDGNLDVGETWSYTATHLVTQEELNGKGTGIDGVMDGDGDTDNRVTATTKEAGDRSSEVSTGLDYRPLIDLEKLVSVDSTNGTDGTFVDADSNATNPNNSFLGPQNINIGSAVWFQVTLDNTGNTTLTDVDVVDVNTTGGLPGTTFDLMLDGALTANAIANFGATLAGDTDNDKQLDVDEVWTITYKQGFDPGQHINTATVTTDEGATDKDDAFYYSLINQGPGVRTPGFWQNMNNGGQFWDGVVGNEKNAGNPGFAEGELLYAVDSDGDFDLNQNIDPINIVKGKSDTAGLLIGDYNMNGVTDAGEDTLFISYTDARTLINANNSQMSNGTVKLGRDVVATWLNYLAGNNIGESSDTESPKHFLDDAIDWFQKYAGKDTDTSAGDIFDVLNISAKNNMTSTGWNFKIDGEHDGGDLHDALDHYNNDGKTSDGGTPYAHDTDDTAFMTAMTALQSSGGSGGGGAEDSGLLSSQQLIII